MTVRTILATAAALATAVTAAAALAAGTVDNPKKLVLQKSDFPAGARVIRTIGPVGSDFGLTYRYRGPNGSSDLSTTVGVTNSEGQATAAFRKLRTDFQSILKNLVKFSKVKPWLTLPRYGDEQFASFHPLDGGKLLVRTGGVVWFLLLQGSGTRTPSKAEVVAELTKYGRKQQQRVGRR